ncbi:hypothetical protein SNE40_005529 [Patella caerulea]|uniref:Citramalyl-CoA lyase, mitochondrial n=1 Tax=Patella caerulea TaxID=87958 RepID=A0AAN8K1Y1_PATCE
MTSRKLFSTFCNKRLSVNGLNKRSVGCYSTSSAERQYIPRRTVMYVPGHDLKKLRKIPQLNTDCAVLECEDGVALSKKAEARVNICQILEEIDFGPIDCAVRVNSVSSGLIEEDLKIILSAKKLPQTVLIPKVDNIDELNYFTDIMKREINRRKETNYRPYLITFIESGQAVMNMVDIIKTGLRFSEEGVYLLDGVVFGSDDFCADIGATRTSEAGELIYARQKIVMTAKAFRLQAIDMVSIDIKDQESLERQSLEGARMGYTGKQIIHPSQIDTVNTAFTPSHDKVEWATQLLDAFNTHHQSGQGAFTFRGSMIDMPLVLQARNILQLVKNIQRKQ